MIFKGSGVALITPFDKNGEVNYFELKRLIEFQISNGTNAIIILGTTGEGSTISYEEREKIIKFSVCIVSGKIPVIVGTGSNSTETAIKLTIQAKSLGADGALIVSPYYNKCNQKGLYLHYKEIAEKSKFPIIIYNVPSRTGVNILPETVKKLSKLKYIVGIKEASGNMKQIVELSSIVPKSFSIYSGDDSLTVPMISIGAKGVISVTANAYPKLVNLMCKYALSGDYSNAKKISHHLQKINSALFFDINPICIKQYMNIIGFNVGKTRLPLCDTDKKTIKKLEEIKKFYEN